VEKKFDVNENFELWGTHGGLQTLKSTVKTDFSTLPNFVYIFFLLTKQLGLHMASDGVLLHQAAN